jgi:hypothetical protein
MARPSPPPALLLLTMSAFVFTSVLSGSGDLDPELRWASFLASIPHFCLLPLPLHRSPSQKGSPSHRAVLRSISTEARVAPTGLSRGVPSPSIHRRKQVYLGK